MERVDTIVIGAGQAGLAASYFLTQCGREHLVLERGEVGETWRSQRWDGFFLNTPNWFLQLPGGAYDGDDPDAFAPLAEVIEYLEGYARSFAAPLRENVEVTALRPAGGDYLVETAGETLSATNVIVASGAFQQPRPRVSGVDYAPVELQLTTSDYRRPGQLPEGAVLVVGGGQSGCQISDELLAAGRSVYLSAGNCAWFPRRHRGHDWVHWVVKAGILDDTVDSLPGPAARLGCNPPISGNDGGHDCHPRWLAARGAVVVGRLESVRDGAAHFASGIEETLTAGDQFAYSVIARIDDYIAEHGLEAGAPEERESLPSPIPDTGRIDLRDAGITTILWSNGYRPDYSWIELEVADEFGWPVQKRGVSEHPGLYFVGVNWLHKRKSALFGGVGEDAEHVISHLVAR
ncbi:MAG: FAD-dependent oxidoreductase [Gaiellaceae bacterium]|nr:FAD-dependent oxidoreductase [Gaiellaceae bacterium]